MNDRPTYRISMGSLVLSTQDANRLVELAVHAGLETPVHECRIVLPQFNDLPIEAGMPVSVQLGYDQKMQLVFSGEIYRLEQGVSTIILMARSACQRLVHSRLDLYFEGMTAGEMVTAICREGNVLPGMIQPGLRFSHYALGRDRSAYDHLSYLANQCGFDLYANENDRLVFAKTTAFAMHSFSYELNIVSFRFSTHTAGGGKWEVFGESPASLGQGPPGAYWLTKKEVKASAGLGGQAVHQTFAPTIRSLDNASLMAKALQQKQKKRKVIRLSTLGIPEVKIGDTIQIGQMPEEQQNGLYKLIDLRHRLNAQSGFISQLKMQEL